MGRGDVDQRHVKELMKDMKLTPKSRSESAVRETTALNKDRAHKVGTTDTCRATFHKDLIQKASAMVS